MTEAEERFIAAALLADVPNRLFEQTKAKLGFPGAIPLGLDETVRKMGTTKPDWLASLIYKLPEAFPALESSFLALVEERPELRPHFDRAKAAYEAI